jgi:hypothetical protein
VSLSQPFILRQAVLDIAGRHALVFDQDCGAVLHGGGAERFDCTAVVLMVLLREPWIFSFWWLL